MLRSRVITAVILILLLLLVVLFLSTRNLAYVFGMLVMLGAWEWSRLCGFTRIIARLAYVGVVLLLMIGSYDWIWRPQVLWNLFLIIFVGWLFTFVWLALAPADKILSHVSGARITNLIGLILLVPAWLALLALHALGQQGEYLLLALLALLGIADSSAYFGGRLMGVTKLAPLISPGKSLEGVYSALVAGSITALIIGMLFGYTGANLVAYISVALFCIVFSVVGDLLESTVKRSAGVKNSGYILPGHGGMMDRVDSLTAAAPLYFLGLSWFPNLLS